MAELEQLREAERFIDEAFGDVEKSHLHCISPHAAKEDESLGKHLTEKEGKLSPRWDLPVS